MNDPLGFSETGKTVARLTVACYGLNVSPSPTSYVKILTCKDDAVKRWGLWEVLKSEGEALMNGISAL